MIRSQREPEPPCERIAVALGEFHDLFACLDDSPRPRDDFFTGGGQRHAFGRTLDELHAEVFLELLELRGQCRLADEAAFRRAPEVARIGDRDEVAQIFEL
jgi:hypothetical protein